MRYGCNPTAKGFNVLADIIHIAADNPSFTCRELFESFLDNNDNYTTSPQGWKIPYKTARYCFKNSGADAAGVYEFVKICSVPLEDIRE